MENKTCKTCINNDDGLCDRKGILIHDDDTCNHHSLEHMRMILPLTKIMDFMLLFRNRIAGKIWGIWL